MLARVFIVFDLATRDLPKFISEKENTRMNIIGYTIQTTEPNQRLQTIPRHFPFQLLKSPARHV
jgi:hypothetical protein